MRMNIQANHSTKDKILDAAEELFAGAGYQSTSLRAITGRAGVNLAAVNYHFGSKEALIEAVIERRLLPLNAKRIERLDAVNGAAQQDGRPPAVRDIMMAFIEPTLRFRESAPGAKNIISLLGRAIVEPDDTVKKRFFNLMMPVTRKMMASLAQALPGVARPSLVNRFHFALGSIFHAMRFYGERSLPEEMLLPAGDMDAFIEELVNYVTAGLEGR